MYKTYVSFWKQLWQLKLNFREIKPNVVNPSLVSATHYYFSDKVCINIDVTALLRYGLYLISRGPRPRQASAL